MNLNSNMNNRISGRAATQRKATLAFVVLALCCACRSSTQHIAANSQLSELQSDEDAHQPLDTGYGLWSEEAPIGWRRPGFVQTYTGVNFNAVEVTDSVQLQSSEWKTIRHEGDASFMFQHLACGALDEFALLGIDDEKDIVIERWSLVGSNGAALERSGGRAEFTEALTAKQFIKQRTFKGARGSQPRGIEMDPSGRFVVYALRDEQEVTTIFQLDCLTPGATPVALVSSYSIPALGEIKYADKFDHATLGRVFVFSTSILDHFRIILADSDNDGVFDGAPIFGDDETLEALGLATYENWMSLDH